MPTPKAIEAYPHHLYMVVESVLTSRHAQDIPMLSSEDAMHLRMQVYGLRKAIKDAKDHPLSEMALKITTRVRGKVLTIAHADETIPEIKQ
jgi:hypothetical protein